MYPLNPTEVDTVSSMNMHITAGVNGPSSVLSMGPEVTLKYEYRLTHPFILRTSLDYRYGKVSSILLPDGELHRGMISLEAIYYRGTDRLTGYIGTGFVAAFSSFKHNKTPQDVVLNIDDGTEISISNAYGLRFTFGLRAKKVYSLEVGITEISPDFVFHKDLGNGRYSEIRENFRFNEFKISLGYLFPLK
jgi:hypothetical protein